MRNDYDVVIIGAGPAGCTVALNLAPFWRVTVLDCAGPVRRGGNPGECLAPTARRLLQDMGLLQGFLREGYAPCYGHRSIWGAGGIETAEGLRDADGHGWLLDREQFDQWLRRAAVERGANIRQAVRVETVSLAASGDWRLGSSAGLLSARVLVDATGRHASISRRIGAGTNSNEPRMIAVWVRGSVHTETPATAGFTFVQAVEDGWWYTAPCPSRRRVVALHLDADSDRARSLRTCTALIERSNRAGELATLLSHCGFTPDPNQFHISLACGGLTTPAAGQNWFAAGDAAVHFDPLSSQGLLNCLFTGLACAESADRVLRNDESDDPGQEYNATISGIYDAYSEHRMHWYGLEDRWPESSFWARRHQASHWKLS